MVASLLDGQSSRHGAASATFGDVAELEEELSNPLATALGKLREKKNIRQKRRSSTVRHGGRLPYELEQLLGDANMAFALGDHAGAIAAAEKVIARAGHHPAPYRMLGLVYAESGDTGRAVEAYRLCVHADATDAGSWARLGALLRDRALVLQEAAETQAGGAFSPAGTMGAAGNGEDSDDDGDHDGGDTSHNASPTALMLEAVAALTRAARLDPSNLGVLLDAAELWHHALGECGKALRVYRAALEHPSLPDPPAVMLRVADLLGQMRDDRGRADTLTDVANYCMGITQQSSGGGEAAPGGGGAAAKAAAARSAAAVRDALRGALLEDDDDDDEDDANEGEEVEGEAAEAQTDTPASPSSSAPAIKSRLDWAPYAMEATRQLCASALAAGDHERVERLIARFAAYAKSHGSSSSGSSSVATGDAVEEGELLSLLPLPLQVTLGVSRLHAAHKAPAAAAPAQLKAAQACLAPMLTRPVGDTLTCDLLLEVAGAMVATGKPGAALSLAGKVRKAVLGAAAPAAGGSSSSSAAGGAPGAPPLPLWAPPLPLPESSPLAGAPGPVLRSFMHGLLLVEGRAKAAQGDAEGAVPLLAAAVAAEPSSLADAIEAARALAGAGALSAGLSLLTDESPGTPLGRLRAAGADRRAAWLLVNAALVAKGAGEPGRFVRLLQAALGTAPPSEHARRRGARQAYVEARLGRGVLRGMVDEAANWLASAGGDPPGALRFVELVLRAAKWARAEGWEGHWAAEDGGGGDGTEGRAKQRGGKKAGAGGTSSAAGADEGPDGPLQRGVGSESGRLSATFGPLRHAMALHRQAGEVERKEKHAALQRARTAAKKRAMRGEGGDDEDDDDDGQDAGGGGQADAGSGDDGDGDEDAGFARKGKGGKRGGVVRVRKGLLPTSSPLLAHAQAEGGGDDYDDGEGEGGKRASASGSGWKRKREVPEVERGMSERSRRRRAVAPWMVALRRVGAIAPVGGAAGDDGDDADGSSAASGPLPLGPDCGLTDGEVEAVVGALRRVAVVYPHHAGTWGALRLLEGVLRAPNSTAFRKAGLRAAMSALDSVPLLLAVGGDCLVGRSYRFAQGVFFEAFRRAPGEPLVCLCLAVASLCQVMSRVVLNRHREAVRAFAFLEAYRAARLREATATAAGNNSGSSDHYTRYLPSHRDDPASRGDSALGITLSAPSALPRFVVEREVAYNCARAAHQLSMGGLATHAYRACLATQAPPGFYDPLPPPPPPSQQGAAASAASSVAGSAGGGSAGAGGPPSAPAEAASARALFECTLNPQREAAFNLCALLRRAGNGHAAAAVAAKHLVY